LFRRALNTCGKLDPEFSRNFPGLSLVSARMKIVWAIVIVLTVLSTAAQFFLGRSDAVYWWDRIPVFWAAFGFAGCVIITLFAKSAGKMFLQREEDYYDKRR
jgi:hypothetical protein